MKTLKFFILTAFIITSGFLFFSCSDDDNKPITLVDGTDNTVKLFYPGNSENGHTVSVQGGDGNYSVKSADEQIVEATMISSIDIQLKVVGLGTTTVTVTDNSQNTLVLNIISDYERTIFVIKAHDIRVTGGDLTENQKKEISEKYLAKIPVKAGGGYEFIHTDILNRKGKAIIYPDIYGGNEKIETTFELKEAEDIDNPEYLHWQRYGYELVINNEKHFFVLGAYYPSQKKEVVIPTALMEDITSAVQQEYPKAESVITSQVIKTDSN